MEKSSAGKASVVKKKAVSVAKKAAPVAEKATAVKKAEKVEKVEKVEKAAPTLKKSVAPTTSTEKKAASTQKTTVAKKKTPPAVKTSTVIEEKDKRLSEIELEGFKAKLLTLRARLRGDVFTMADAALNKNRMESSGDLSTMPIHMADIGSDNFEQEQTLSFMQSEHGLLDMVEDALQRMKEGMYGLCEDCDCRIPKARLNALPYAAKCVKCAASNEQD